ncbi:MAG TPA: hypothetical protein VHE34_06585 [Puia sp.]|uniref:hypothetical protein n=1 Tax=Puia sp. TaxID=2045100 RepID=UPI002C56EE82|nr:hypothetical protein [Puia sp.]HVU94872.1 hypothetical protein [Puia sp.]
MARKSWIILLLAASWLSGQAQPVTREDVVFLHNHWVIRGRILARSDSSLSIQTHDGSVFVFPRREVDSTQTAPPWLIRDQNKRRWTNFTELGPLIAGKTTVDGVTTAAFSFQTVMCFRFHPAASPGLGAGADLYATQTVIPLFGTVRGDLLQRKPFSLFYFVDLGLGKNITQRPPDGSVFKGGFLYATGLGLRIPFNNTAGFLLSIGYRYQSTSMTPPGQQAEQIIYRRVALRAGFYL